MDEAILTYRDSDENLYEVYRTLEGHGYKAVVTRKGYSSVVIILDEYTRDKVVEHMWSLQSYLITALFQEKPNR